MSKADRKPKKIAGLKLPKSIRRAPAIRSLLASKAGRKILNDAFMAGAALAAQRVMEAHDAAKSKAAGGKKVVKFEKRARAEKAPKTEQVAQVEQLAQPELTDEVEQVAEQIEVEEPVIEVEAEEPVVALVKRKPGRRSKATKSAPDAAPVDDVVPTAVEELIPDAEEAEPMVDEPVAGGSEEVEDLRARPGAAD